MQEIELRPHAASLIQSMRDIGYSLETALADLIDNSISAHAKLIRIFLAVEETSDPCLVIIDDGSGMTQETLIEAMRPGARNPRDKRDKHDLGRFGLGLKTASFSQCKSLTVVSRKNGSISGAKWDLDIISVRNEWVVSLLSQTDISTLPFIEELSPQGTYVLWQKLDRLIEHNQIQVPERIYEKFALVRNHLALVFHRFLGGIGRREKLAIEINGDPVEAFDPFCTANNATQVLPSEIVRINNSQVKIQPYILPHHNKLQKHESDLHQARNDFVNNQGIYVYRNNRLLVWGDWFRIIPKGEATKLARIQIDFTNALDECWTIDIKKSRAYPPYEVREKLKQIIERITDQSKKVYVGRGNRLYDAQVFPLWLRYSNRPSTRYEINRNHPIINGFKDLLDQSSHSLLENILSVIESSIPIDKIYADYASEPAGFDEIQVYSDAELKSKLTGLYTLVVLQGAMDRDSFARMVISIKPFSDYKEIVDSFIKELNND